MRIHTDHNGVAVNAISTLADGTDVEGHFYQVLAGAKLLGLRFQHGGVAENGVNGITNEALLAILIHRTKHLNNKFACDENVRAITHMEEALVNLEVRSARRIVRGVEGKDGA
jgi:hypothetical protein